MPSKSPLTALRDILHHIELAEHFVTGFDDKAFIADARTVYAVTRCLEVISEASRRLPAGLKARHSVHSMEKHCGCREHISSRL
jgi:uncharacterized protein with HEPN domain